jgi:hypothetical protein
MREMKDKILKKLVCPICSVPDKSDTHLSMVTDTKPNESPTLFCNNCQSRFAPIDAILNLAGDVIPTTIHVVSPPAWPVFVSDERDKPDGSSSVSMRRVQ